MLEECYKIVKIISDDQFLVLHVQNIKNGTWQVIYLSNDLPKKELYSEYDLQII